MNIGMSSSSLDAITILQAGLQKNGDAKTRDWWQNYVKEAAPFLGVKMQTIRSLVHDWYKEEITDSFNPTQQVHLALSVIKLLHTEEKLAGIIFLHEILLSQKFLSHNRDIDRFAALFYEGHIYDWNVCDWFCVKLLSGLIKKDGQPAAISIAKWHSAENLWQARASVVAFVNSASQREYYPLINKSCEKLIARPERFAKTAVGWILREINKHDHSFVTRFIEKNLSGFSTESLKKAMKYFETDKIKYLKMHKH